jgi:hypothetical protein
LTRADLVITTTNVDRMTATQWKDVSEIRALLPHASVTMRVHEVIWKRDGQIGLSPTFGVVVTQRVEPFTLRREYAVGVEDDPILNPATHDTIAEP